MSMGREGRIGWVGVNRELRGEKWKTYGVQNFG